MQIEADDRQLADQLALFLKRFDKERHFASFSFLLKRGEEEKIVRHGSEVQCFYNAKVQVFEEIGYLLGASDFAQEIVFPCRIKELTFMLDCSRNAVMSAPSLKKLIDQLAFLGYDSLMLYTEDTFEVESEPLFGYFRGAYTAKEIKAIDAYSARYGIELVPCIEALGHMGGLKRYGPYRSHFDEKDILLVGDEKIRGLLEHMFATLAHNFHSRRVNIGLDEAYGIGRGRFYDLHGPVSQFTIMRNHLTLLEEIAKKYGFRLSMWSDMFFALASQHYYEQKMKTLSPEILASVPNDVELIYWDYYHTDKQHYLDMMSLHQFFPNEIAFATGAWRWYGFAPCSRYSEATLVPGFQAAIEKQLNHVLVTAWGDNGGEASQFSILPALFLASEQRHGEDFHSPSFAALSGGLSEANMIALDEVNDVFKNSPYPNNSTRMFLFNDPLCGVYDCFVPKGAAEHYKKTEKLMLSLVKKAGPYAYIYQTLAALAKVLSHKADFGVRLRKAYQSHDIKALSALEKEVRSLIRLVADFDRCFARQWDKENKPFGYDVQDIRIGALKERLEKTAEKIHRFIFSGKRIPELEVSIQPICDPQEVGEYVCFNSWRDFVSVNVND